MKLLSISRMSEALKFSFKEFTLSVLFSLAGSVLLIINIENSLWGLNEETAAKLIFCAFFGVPLFIGFRLFEIRRNFGMAARIVGSALGLALITLIYFTTDEFLGTFQFKLVVYSLAVLFFASIAFYINVKNEEGFWQINKIFFLRTLLTALFINVLYSGLIIAVLALRELFGIKFGFEVELDIAVVIFGFVSLLIFLPGLPQNLHEIDEYTDYPKLLKIFGQFILLPLTAIYFLIIYAFFIKIIIEWNLPKGFVSLMILAYGVTGILTLLLVYPARKENKWINLYKSAIFASLLPLSLLLWLSISKRVEQYGITPPRYFVIALAVWLVIIPLYYLIRRNASVKLIPASLLILAVLVSAGPWNAYNVSEKSQKKEVVKFIEKEKLFGKAGKEKLSKNRELFNKLSAKLTEHANFYGGDELSSALSGKLGLKKDAGIKEVFAHFDMKYEKGKDIQEQKFVNFYTESTQLSFDISGYDLMSLTLDSGNYTLRDSLEISWKSSAGIVTIFVNGKNEISIDIKGKLRQYTSDDAKGISLEEDETVYKAESDKIAALIYIESAYLNFNSKYPEEDQLGGKLFVRIKK